MIAEPISSRIPVREILGRALHPPVRERAFWFIQFMVVIWAIFHMLVDVHTHLGGTVFPLGVPIDMLLVPLGYAALHYGLSGSAATTLWSVLLWMPDLALPRDEGHFSQDLVQLGIVAVVALFVGLEIERAHLERARAENAEADRRAAEIHYHRLFDANASPIVLIDERGLVAEANPAATALWGDVVGTRIEGLLHVDDEYLVDGRSPRTLVLESRAGDERFYRLSVSHLGSLQDGPLRQVVLEDVTEEYRSESEARAWAVEVLKAQEEERRRIAREIHDDPLQRLLQVARQMEALGSADPRDGIKQVGAVREELLGVVGHLRDVTRGLHPAGLEQYGLVAAVRGLLVDIEIGEGLITAFDVTGEAVRATPEAEVSAFRIIQEAARNVIHHAEAEVLSVQLAYGDGTMRITVTDDGHGFDLDAANRIAQSHLGLLSMRERANLLGGTCVIRSARGTGTTVEAVVPLGHRAVVGARPDPPLAARPDLTRG